MDELKKYRYFIAYAASCRVGRTEVHRDAPIICESDLREIEKMLEAAKGVAPIVITNWCRFEDPE